MNGGGRGRFEIKGQGKQVTERKEMVMEQGRVLVEGEREEKL